MENLTNILAYWVVEIPRERECGKSMGVLVLLVSYIRW